MFRQYRIRKLERDMKIQNAKIQLLWEGFRNFKDSYYYDRWIDANVKLIKMEDKFAKL